MDGPAFVSLTLRAALHQLASHRSKNLAKPLPDERLQASLRDTITNIFRSLRGSGDNISDHASHTTDELWNLQDAIIKVLSILQIKGDSICSDMLRHLMDIAYTTQDLVDSLDYRLQCNSESEMEINMASTSAIVSIDYLQSISAAMSNSTALNDITDKADDTGGSMPSLPHGRHQKRIDECPQSSTSKNYRIHNPIDSKRIVSKRSFPSPCIFVVNCFRVEHRRKATYAPSLLSTQKGYGFFSGANTVNQKERLIQLLLTSDGEDVSIVPVLGVGGIGKTTLANYAYNDERVEKHFHVRAWICAQDNLNMMKNISENRKLSDSTNELNDLPQPFENLKILEWTIQEDLKGRRFLLVLDNITSPEWLKLCITLGSDVKGCKILVTAREELVGEVGKENKIVLEGLKGDTFWTLFRNCAFGDVNPKAHPKLLSIGKEIAKKLKGSPLAAKMVGAILQKRLDHDHWINILNNDIWGSENKFVDFMPSLILSYQCLPAHLQQCFAYCSVFPKGYSFDVNKLIGIWMAQGLIHHSEEISKRSEEIALDYFNELASLSFFELPMYTKSYGPENYYVMQDLLHDLACSVCKDECFIFDRQSKAIPLTVRHLSIINWREDAHFEFEWKMLRTLVINSTHRLNFRLLRSIRVLDLSYSCMRHFPDAIGDLIYLRYLDLTGNDISSLPKTLGRLYLMQTLMAPHMCRRLPKEITNLTSLKHLTASETAILWISRIGKLTCLQELKEFNVKVVKGHDIGQLKDMRHLRGELCISNLDILLSKEEAIEANLKDKVAIHKLKFKWGRWKGLQNIKSNETQQTEGSKGGGLAGLQLPNLYLPFRPASLSSFPTPLAKPWMQDEVLEFLQPPPGLKQLDIHWFRGDKSPSWLSATYLRSLDHVDLRGCVNWRWLPPLGQFPFLQYLRMYKMDVAIAAGDGTTLFPSLKELSLEDTSVSFEGMLVKIDSHMLFPHLCKLSVRNCSKVEGLPPLSMLSTLEELEIKSCPDLDSEVPTCLKDLPSLTTLRIRTQRLAPFPGQLLRRLKHLEIDSCPNPTSCLARPPPQEKRRHKRLLIHLISLTINDAPLPTGPILLYLTSIKELKIDRCSTLRTFTSDQQEWFQELTSLSDLSITRCKNLTSLPAGLDNLTSLQKLAVTDCPMIRSLPKSLPASLKRLDIWNCSPGLTSQWLDQRAPDWLKSIPYKTLG